LLAWVNTDVCKFENHVFPFVVPKLGMRLFWLDFQTSIQSLPSASETMRE